MARSPDIRETLARIKQLGFAACDVAIFEGWQNANPSSLVAGNQVWVDAFLKGLSATQLHVSSLNCGLSRQLNDPDPVALEQQQLEMDVLVDLAARVGCPNITIQPGQPVEGRPIEDLLRLVQSRLTRLGSVAQARGVTLSVEGHQGSLLEDPARALAMMEVLWPAVGFTYDPSHWSMQRIPLPDTEALLPYTYHVHVRSAAPERMQAPLAEGTVDFAWLVRALGASGYSGDVTIEYFNDFDPDFAETLALRDHLVSLGL